MAASVGDQGLRGPEAHGLGGQDPGVEVLGLARLEPSRGVDQVGEGEGVGLGEAELGERPQLAVDRLRSGRVDAPGPHSGYEFVTEGVHALDGSFGPHGLTQAVCLGGAEACGVDGDLHELLLEERHPQGLSQGGLEGAMQVGDLLAPQPAADVGVDGVALDGAGADEGDLDDDVVKLLRPESGQGGHLGTRLDLEDPDRVRGREQPVDGRVLLGQGVQSPGTAGLGGAQFSFRHGLGNGLSPLRQCGEGQTQGGERSQAQEVELDQPGLGAVVLVPLEDRAVVHGGPAHRADLGDGAAAQDHASGVDPQVAGQPQQLLRDVEDRLRDLVALPGQSSGAH